MPTATASRGLSSLVATPEQISGILLSDGWHQVQGAQFTHFAIAQGMSEPQPNSIHAAIAYTENGEEVVTPLRQVLSYRFKDSYKSESFQNQQSSSSNRATATSR